MAAKSFRQAADKMLKNQPQGDKAAMKRALLQLRQLRLTRFDALSRSLHSLRRDTLIAALRLLPYFDRQQATKPLLSMLQQDQRPLIRLEAAKILGGLRSKTTARRLMACLRKELDADARYWLTYALTCLADPMACSLFLAVLQNHGDRADVRSQAAEGLAYTLPAVDKRTRLYRRALKALKDALDDGHAEMRFWAAFALGNAKAASAIDKLRQLAETDKAMCPGWWPVGLEAADAIQVIKGDQWPERTCVRKAKGGQVAETRGGQGDR